MFGAGGGGGGGGSGGGFNGGGTTDGCYAGGSWRNASVGLQQVANALGFANGAAGTQGGCTAGGGGGGGASAGPSGSASGGDGGQAGVGHNGNGGGTGGRQGDSALQKFICMLLQMLQSVVLVTVVHLETLVAMDMLRLKLMKYNNSQVKLAAQVAAVVTFI